MGAFDDTQCLLMVLYPLSSPKPQPTPSTPGPFGSGKSTLLVALIHLLTATAAAAGAPSDAAGDAQPTGDAPGKKAPGVPKGRGRSARGGGSSVRVLVAAHTNVAVDRVLMGLAGGRWCWWLWGVSNIRTSSISPTCTSDPNPHESNVVLFPPHQQNQRPDAGFSDMLRVGALPRIARPLLKYSLHSGDDSRDAASQLQAVLPHASGRDAELIRWVGRGWCGVCC